MYYSGIQNRLECVNNIFTQVTGKNSYKKGLHEMLTGLFNKIMDFPFLSFLKFLEYACIIFKLIKH